MGLFSKLKDYNLELEEILDSKIFSANIKNLLLNMIYKLEISYNDYSVVKRYVRSKEDFLNEIVESIRLYCDNVKIVEPDSKEAEMLKKNDLRALTNEFERSILTYPTEIDLLYALSDITPKYFYINEIFPLKNLIQTSLVNGYNINNVEILKDFNGWSWDSKYENNFKYIDNLIYINLLVILGEKFLYEWRVYGSTRKDFLGEMKKYIKSYTGNDDYFNYFFKTIYYFADKDEKNKVDSDIREKSALLRRMSDKICFLNDMKEKRIKLSKKLAKIDLALNDKETLKKEFEKNNIKLGEKNKIKSINKYRNIISKEKEKLIKEINSTSEIIKPSNYLHEKRALEESLEFLKCKEESFKLLVKFQMEFLDFVEKRLSQSKTSAEVIDVIYFISYYSGLYVSKKVSISDIEEISDKLDVILKKAITALCKLGAIKIISMDIDLNFEIIKYIIDSKIINLEEVKVSFSLEKDGIMIKVFDKDVFEKQGKKKITVTKKTLNVKENKKIKLFN